MKTRASTDPHKANALGRALAESRRGDAPEARHAQLRAALIRCIEAGHWGPGERLPTEAELIALSGFSLGTVQRALRSLVEDGIVNRQQGSGSFVADRHQRIDDLAFARFEGDDGESLLPVYSRVTGRHAVRPTRLLRGHFPDASARILRIDRVLNVNDEFEVASHFFFDGRRFRGLAGAPLAELAGANFKVMLGREHALPEGELRQTLQVVEAPADVALALRLAPPVSVGLLEIVRNDATSGNAVYYQRMFIPAGGRALRLLPVA